MEKGLEIDSRLFGHIWIKESKIVTFVDGLVGFPELRDFALIHDEEGADGKGIKWLQSLQDGNFALPVINPLEVVDDYNPTVNDDLLTPLGEMSGEDMFVLVTISVPEDVTKMTINLKGPIIINVNNGRATQVVVENDDYDVRFPIYDILKARKGGE